MVILITCYVIKKFFHIIGECIRFSPTKKKQPETWKHKFHMEEKIIFKLSHSFTLTGKGTILLMVCESLITDKCSCWYLSSGQKNANMLS